MKVVLVVYALAAVGSVNASSSVSFDYDSQDLWKNLKYDDLINECGGDANSPINVPADVAASCTNNTEGIQLNVSRRYNNA